MLAGTTLVAFYGGLLRVALPVIRAELSADVADVQMVSLAGLVAVTATVVAFGRAADVVGARRVYSTGLVFFAAGGVLSAWAPTLGWLVGGQAVQGFGGSMCVGSGTPLIVRAFGPEERGRVVAGTHMAVAVGLAAGPAVGGLVVEHLGWRVAFVSLVPPALALAALALARLPADAPSGPRQHFDLAGAAVLAGALGVLLIGIDQGGRGGLRGGGLLTVVVVTLAALVVFVVVERHSPQPVVDVGLFASRGFSAGLAASFLNFIAMASNMFLLPFFLQEVLGQSASGAGAVMMVVPAAILVVAPLAGTVADRVAPRLPATLGMAIITLAVWLMAGLRPGVSLTRIVAVLVLYGIGAALFQSPNISGVLGSAPADRLGVASGTLSTVGRLGQVAGIAVAGNVWQGGLGPGGQSAQAAPAAFQRAFLVLAAFGALAAVASWLRGPVSSTDGGEPGPVDEVVGLLRSAGRPRRRFADLRQWREHGS